MHILKSKFIARVALLSAQPVTVLEFVAVIVPSNAKHPLLEESLSYIAMHALLVVICL